jgi:predicted pyridoxine 5'-phosphate oxidase superfamily flavin-nucleotide-binding protein
MEAQQHFYGKTYRPYEQEPVAEQLGASEARFIEQRDSFYLATVTENGWPYLQHRGGPPGFVRVLGPRQIGFADYRGNRQMISVGSISQESRVSLFMMDYPGRQRLKLLGHANVFDAREDPELAEKVVPPSGHGDSPERIFLIDILSYDWNCPKFITPRFTAEEVEGTVAPLRKRIAALEAQLAVDS